MEPVAETVTPFTTTPLVRYRASLAIGLLSEAIGMPRELNTMQAVLLIALPPLSRHGSACAAVVWPSVGPTAICVPNPKVSPCERFRAAVLNFPVGEQVGGMFRSDSATQQVPALYQTWKSYEFPVRSALTRTW